MLAGTFLLGGAFSYGLNGELQDATEELKKIEAFRKAQAEVNKPVKQSAFNVM